MKTSDGKSQTTKRLAIEAMRNLPLPSQGATVQENYRRFLNWLYAGDRTPASLVIDLEFGDQADAE